MSLAPDAWMHILHMEGGRIEKRLTLWEQSPFGVSGQDYDEEYNVTSDPLFLRTEREAPAKLDVNDIRALLDSALSLDAPTANDREWSELLAKAMNARTLIEQQADALSAAYAEIAALKREWGEAAEWNWRKGFCAGAHRIAALPPTVDEVSNAYRAFLDSQRNGGGK